MLFRFIDSVVFSLLHYILIITLVVRALIRL